MWSNRILEFFIDAASGSGFSVSEYGTSFDLWWACNLQGTTIKYAALVWLSADTNGHLYHLTAESQTTISEEHADETKAFSTNTSLLLTINYIFGTNPLSTDTAANLVGHQSNRICITQDTTGACWSKSSKTISPAHFSNTDTMAWSSIRPFLWLLPTPRELRCFSGHANTGRSCWTIPWQSFHVNLSAWQHCSQHVENRNLIISWIALNVAVLRNDFSFWTSPSRWAWFACNVLPTTQLHLFPSLIVVCRIINICHWASDEFMQWETLLPTHRAMHSDYRKAKKQRLLRTASM